MWHPKCYLARQDLLVLEDLSVKGYDHVSIYHSYDVAHIKCALRSIAAMHACSLRYESSGSGNIIEQFGTHLTESFFQKKNQWYYTGLKVRISIL